MMKVCDSLMLGYDLIAWEEQGKKQPIVTDVSISTNTHLLVTGMSGSGKSYAILEIVAKNFLLNSACEVYFADYKNEDCYAFLRDCPRYYAYKRTTEALDIVYDRLQKRQSGEDKSRNPVILLWDEYVANILYWQNVDKKKASSVMNKVSELLMLGRSMNVRLFASVQRPDASVFTSGARLNFGVVMILGASIRSIYEMLIPDHMHMVKDMNFGRGEGVLLLQGSELRFIKIPTVRDESRMRELCIKALS